MHNATKPLTRHRVTDKRHQRAQERATSCAAHNQPDQVPDTGRRGGPCRADVRAAHKRADQREASNIPFPLHAVLLRSIFQKRLDKFLPDRGPCLRPSVYL